MKKKMKRFAEGGITDDVRQRAAFYAALAAGAKGSEETSEQKDFMRKVREAQQAEAEASDNRRASSRPASASSAPAPSRPALRSAVSQDRPAYPTARRVADEYSGAEDADIGRGMREAAMVRDAEVSIPPAAGLAPRSASRSAPTTPARGLIPNTPFEDANRARLARIEEDKERIAAVRKAAQQDLLERETPSRIPQNVMGVRAAQQMEEKGSIYSPDYGLSRAEREQRQSLRDLAKGIERTDEDVQAARRRADTAAARRAIASAASRDVEDYEAGQAAKRMMREAEQARSSRRAEVESNRAREEAEEGAARRRQRVSAATPPVPAPGTRAFANAPERAQRRSERQTGQQAERNLANEVKRAALQDILERSRTTRETSALRRRNDESSPGFKKGGMVSSASKRADGIATKGKTRGKYL